MERGLDVYKRPYEPLFPVVCMDETSRQLIRETRLPLPAGPGVVARYDYEYERCGVCNIFMAVEPLAGKRIVEITEHRAKRDWASFLNNIARCYPDAEKITLVMDNLNTHRPGSLYEVFPPAAAKALWDRFEFIYTPKHGSWLNIAEIELSALTSQCLNRRIDNLDTLNTELTAWQSAVNTDQRQVNWHFTTSDARTKLRHLYPEH